MDKMDNMWKSVNQSVRRKVRAFNGNRLFQHMTKKRSSNSHHIGELQTTLLEVQDQKYALESQIADLQNRLNEKELEEETANTQQNAKIEELENEILALRQRAEEAERKLEEEKSSIAQTPPAVIVQVTQTVTTPSPPPPPVAPPPPPPPLPAISVVKTGLNLKKGARSDKDDSKTQSLIVGGLQMDDLITQLKKGVKLRPVSQNNGK